MKKTISAIVILVMLFVVGFALVGCFDYTEFPDMVEYDEETVLETAKAKYGIDHFIYTSDQLHGKVDKSDGVKIEYLLHDSYSTEFINPSDTDSALTAFAGKNGNHDIQGMYNYFLCYIALGITEDGNAKFIYYNTNIHKDAELADTIGASDYPYDILPSDITDGIYQVNGNWLAMNTFLNKVKGKGYRYTEQRLTKSFESDSGGRGLVDVVYYRENDKVAYDIYYSEPVNGEYDKYEEASLIYSTSERYGVLYYYYGFDKTEYFDIEFKVEPSTEDESCDLIKGTVGIKDFGRRVVYSQLSTKIEYYVLKDDGTPILHGTTKGPERYTDTITQGVLAERIEGVDHSESATFELTRFYVLYEK